jgi:molybdate transport system substrate-binding protein
VAAASDLAFAFPEVAKAFEAHGGAKPAFTFGSSGILAKQIEEGAPFDVFAAANISFAEDVVKSGACEGATKAAYGRGRIVMWARGGAQAPRTIADIADPKYRKIAIANPEHAPYGRAAKQALQHAGVWDAVKDRVVFGENIQQTMTFARTGDADVAFVALSLALADTAGSRVDVDPSLHAPIDQALVVCKHGKARDAGKSFADFVGSPEGRAIMNRFGFLLPGEVVAESH